MKWYMVLYWATLIEVSGGFAWHFYKRSEARDERYEEARLPKVTDRRAPRAPELADSFLQCQPVLSADKRMALTEKCTRNGFHAMIFRNEVRCVIRVENGFGTMDVWRYKVDDVDVERSSKTVVELRDYHENWFGFVREGEPGSVVGVTPF